MIRRKTLLGEQVKYLFTYGGMKLGRHRTFLKIQTIPDDCGIILIFKERRNELEISYMAKMSVISKRLQKVSNL